VVGAGVPHDVGDGLGMFFAVQRDSVRHLTLLTDGGLPVGFESSMRRELLTMPPFLHQCIQRRGDYAGWWCPSLLVKLWRLGLTSSTVQTL
jgi:hypothetical protein